MGWGSGTAQFPYLIDPLSAIQNRAIKDHTTVTWWRSNFELGGIPNAVAQQSAAVCFILRLSEVKDSHRWAQLVFIHADSGEDYITVDGNEGDRSVRLTLLPRPCN